MWIYERSYLDVDSVKNLGWGLDLTNVSASTHKRKAWYLSRMNPYDSFHYFLGAVGCTVGLTSLGLEISRDFKAGAWES